MKATDRIMIINRVIFMLSLVGVVIAAYVLQGWLRGAAILCPAGSGGCDAVAKSPYSYPFGIPVPAVGLAGYITLAVLSFLRTTTSARWVSKAILGMGVFGVCFVTWFTWVELTKIHGVCTWCAISAVNMIVIFFLSLISLK